MSQHLLPRFTFDARTYEYVEVHTGERIPYERFDEYARQKLEESLDRLASAWAKAATQGAPE